MSSGARYQRGVTLIEVMVAIAILAVIATISYQTLSAVLKSKEVVEAKLKEIARIDRAWLLLENDIKNVLSYEREQVFGPGSKEMILPLIVEPGGDHELLMLRGGHANPLFMPRSELIRVGYRFEDETLWRDVWYDIASVDQEKAREQKIVEGVEEIEIEVLSDRARSFIDGPWLDRWDVTNQSQSKMPMALRIKIKLENYEEITRLFTLLKGE